MNNAEVGLRPTGIKELDNILNGGLPREATVLLAGNSGSGKSILCLQWLFAGWEQEKEPGIYISMTEPIYKTMRSLRKFSFFKKESVDPMQIYFTDLRTVIKGLELEDKTFTSEDVAKLIEALRNMVERSKARRLVLDSITALAYRIKEKDLIRDFIFQLGTLLAQLDCSVILTSEVIGEGYSVFGVEEFIADGIIRLSYLLEHHQPIRKLEVIKMRGLSYNAYPALFRVSRDGILLYPHQSRELTYAVSDKRLSSGIEGLDKMTTGGYFIGSCLLVAGASGTGKTIMALQFAACGLKAGERVIYLSYEESHDQLIRNSRAFGWDLQKYEAEGRLKILASYPEERYLEEQLNFIHQQVEEFSPQRVVIDSLSSLGSAFSEDILYDFTARLIAYLKQKNVTVIFTIATTTLMGAGTITEAHLSTLTDHIIMLRYVELESALHHAVLILKMRGSAHDKKLREVVFTPEGLRIATEFKGYEGVLGGAARKVAGSIEEQLRLLFTEILGPMGERIFEREKNTGLTIENVGKLIKELGDQGIISPRRKQEFLAQAESILGRAEIVSAGPKVEGPDIVNLLKGV